VTDGPWTGRIGQVSPSFANCSSGSRDATGPHVRQRGDIRETGSRHRAWVPANGSEQVLLTEPFSDLMQSNAVDSYRYELSSVGVHRRQGDNDPTARRRRRGARQDRRRDKLRI
jgi:hypothetical protein